MSTALSTENHPELVRQVSEHALREAASLIHLMTRRELGIELQSDGYTEINDNTGVLPSSSQHLLMVSQEIKGAVDGYALLLADSGSAQQLTRDMLGERRSTLAEWTEIEQEAFAELANILLNHCLGNFLEIGLDRVECGLPRIKTGIWQDLRDSLNSEERDDVSVLHLGISMSFASCFCPVHLLFSRVQSR